MRSSWWLPLPFLGIPPWMVFVGFSVRPRSTSSSSTPNVSENSGRPIEFIFNTPSHHRVHHGSDAEYLDRNYAGILIIWDRMFGTFAAETHRPTYGLTTPVGTYNIWKLQTREYAAIARDWKGVDIVAAASRLRVRPARLGAESRGHFSRIHSPVALSRSRATARVAPIPKAGVAFSAENWANRLGRDRRS